MSRELLAKVAELMGWYWPDDCCEWCGWPLDAAGIGCLPDNCSQRPMPKVKQSTDYPPYSTDISAAWLVVEKMQSIGEINIGFDNRATPAWRCVIFGRDGDLTDVEVYADAAPEAICLAALKAVEE